MVRISRDFVTDRFGRKQKAAAFCESGEEVMFETRDCYDDNDISEKNPLGSNKNVIENPATGPLFVRGAEAGDILRVEILNIKLRDYGIMRTSTSCGAFSHLYQERTARRFFFEKRREEEDKGERNKETGRYGEVKEGFWFDRDLWLDCDAMIGVIGTAPQGEEILTVTPGRHGGNMDCTRIRQGAVLYLPVNVDGAWLALGDLHARMGDGEVMICGMETAGEVSVRVSLIKKGEGMKKGLFDVLPVVVEGNMVCSIQSAKTLDEAAVLATRKMEAFLAEAAGIDDVKAGMLMSLLGNLAVCQIVNPWKTVRCEFPIKVMETYGVRF